MNEEERYLWDLTGHLVVKGVMTAAELDAANAAVDFLWDRIEPGEEDGGTGGSQSLRGWGSLMIQTDATLLQLEKPHCEPFRRMLAHPAVVSRLNLMCGTGFRFDHGPHFIGGIKGTVGLRLHGAGDPHRPYVAYHHQDGQMYCGGVTVSWNLTDAQAGDGGFACVPGSHKSRYPMPIGVRTCDEDMGVVVQPPVEAGDVLFFMDGAQTHGTHPWRGDHQRRALLFKYASRTSARTGASSRLAPPEIYWGEQTVEGMTAQQRAVMHGPCAAFSEEAHLTVEVDGTVRLG
jgi:hypothetical protein